MLDQRELHLDRGRHLDGRDAHLAVSLRAVDVAGADAAARHLALEEERGPDAHALRVGVPEVVPAGEGAQAFSCVRAIDAAHIRGDRHLRVDRPLRIAVQLDLGRVVLEFERDRLGAREHADRAGEGLVRDDDVREAGACPRHGRRVVVPGHPRAVIPRGVAVRHDVIHEAKGRVGHGEALGERRDVEDLDRQLVARHGARNTHWACDDVHRGEVAVRLVEVQVGVRDGGKGAVFSIPWLGEPRVGVVPEVARTEVDHGARRDGHCQRDSWVIAVVAVFLRLDAGCFKRRDRVVDGAIVLAGGVRLALWRWHGREFEVAWAWEAEHRDRHDGGAHLLEQAKS
mmetsp:Transcript_41068/g.133114  ORF Transcript_41068/g.133114 Transcript_41068/m.133114 type:complete len:342 (-) Transcript_41068:21-1046(-)